MRIAFDLSRVIIRGGVKHDPDFVVNGNVYLPDAVPTLNDIVAYHGASEILVFSRVKDDAEEEAVWRWIAQHNFYAYTGILPGNVHLCRKRAEKRALCERFRPWVAIDDRFEVLHQLVDIVPRLVLFQGRKKEILKEVNQPHFELLHSRIDKIESWRKLGRYLLAA